MRCSAPGWLAISAAARSNSGLLGTSVVIAATVEEITITRHGHPVAVLLRPDAVRARRAEQAIEQARQIGALVAAAREQPLATVDMTDQRVEELVEAARAGRRRS
jgi:antitoxin (DNA-binding transcriptional repressor) of toxin-antitoxin stability system